MENWNEWSWLAIPMTAWAVAWAFVKLSDHAHSAKPKESVVEKFIRLQNEAWKVTTRTESPKQDEAKD